MSYDDEGSRVPNRADVMEAAQRLEGRAIVTPVLPGRSLNELAGCELLFKCENLQRTGSFKYRGAVNASLQLGRQAATRGVVTHSSGNHGAALALAATQLGVPVRVVVPVDAMEVKRQAIARYGAQVIDCGPTLEERESRLKQVVVETGAEVIPPYNDTRVIAGQGTAALELRETVPDLDQVWVPVGGGGLASGTVLALSPPGGAEDESTALKTVAVHGAEPLLADDAYRSMLTGVLQPQNPPVTIADGLRTALGTLTFGILFRYGLPIHRVEEQEILSAQKLIWQRLKLVVEPSAAVPLAGVLKLARDNPEAVRDKRIGVILSGGNAGFPELEPSK